MSWNAARASTWMRNYADDLARDSYYRGADLYAEAGAAYFAVSEGVGYNTEAEFRLFVKQHLKLDDDFADDAVKEIKE